LLLLETHQMAHKEKPRYDGHCRHLSHAPEGIQPVVRFKNPVDGEVVVADLIKGNVVFKNTELDDLIIARSDSTPTYNFTVVVDDWDMQITHVIRGDDLWMIGTCRSLTSFVVMITSITLHVR